MRGSARARAQLLVFPDLNSPELTAWAFGGGCVAGVDVCCGVYSGQIYVCFVVLFVIWCENYQCVRVLHTFFHFNF